LQLVTYYRDADVKRPSRFLILTLSGALLLAGCGRAGPPSAGPWPALSDSAFAVLVSDFSERGRYFDTDNLISNEATYLEVVDALSRYGVIGGAYIGVGPDQNFSYIARVNPQVAFIVDIRRDNLLQHLWFKALFTEAATRVEFLALMYGKPVPDSLASWRERSLEDLARYIDTVAVAPNVARAAMVTVQRAIAQDGVELSADDRVTILDIHQRFIVAGLDLRFRSHGRGSRSCYPTHRFLLMDGGSTTPSSYLATKASYQVVRNLQVDNLVIPVVGDLAGEHALSAIAGYLRQQGTMVSAFYTSNVEFYLFDDGVFSAFARNLEALPTDTASVIIRSVFRRGGAPIGPIRVGSCSVQSLQRIDALADWLTGDRFPSYYDMVRYDLLPLP
jgi:hypothetical protein